MELACLKFAFGLLCLLHQQGRFMGSLYCFG